MKLNGRTVMMMPMMRMMNMRTMMHAIGSQPLYKA